MALTPEQIDTAYRKVWSTVPHAQRLSAFALEIETEVRKEYTELIRQVRGALADCAEDSSTVLGDYKHLYTERHRPERLHEQERVVADAEKAIAAANARLEGT